MNERKPISNVSQVFFLFTLNSKRAEERTKHGILNITKTIWLQNLKFKIEISPLIIWIRYKSHICFK